MKCQECNNATATIIVKKRQDDKEVSVNLCPVCAQKMGWSNPLEDVKFPLAHFISSMMTDISSTEAQKGDVDAGGQCADCGLSFQEFSRTGRLGCGHCYEAFREPMQDLLRRIHGGVRHQGKRPAGATKTRKAAKSNSMRQVKADLEKAIAEEDFESAAQLRDKLQELQKRKETRAVKAKAAKEAKEHAS
jgi:protein arginine kinase activator